MFGGQNTETGIDFWIWDGSVWTRIATMPSPPARYETALVYDSTRGRAVLFGGANVVFPPSVGNETWVWDGSKWLQEFPAVSPRVQCCHSMAYDPVHDQVLLFGATGETWVWTSGDLPGPTVTSVQSAAGFGGFSQVAPGSWIEIFGGNLAFSTRAWSVADFNGNNAPTSLDDVQVDIGGQKAFVDYESSSPGQINAQLPSNIPAGTLQLTVTNRSGTSQPFSIKVNKNQPGLLAPASFLIGGKQYAVAVLPGGSYALPSGTFFSAANRPAKPGETVTLYGIGFGAVTPDIPAGLVVTQSNQLAQAFELRIGGSPVELPYYGLAPGAVGLYQFNAVVPSISDNDLAPVTFTLDGVPGTQTLYIAVHQ
jgi:uncharacterized protein (TIGR03437 family)